jgi:hypothetical protein
VLWWNTTFCFGKLQIMEPSEDALLIDVEGGGNNLGNDFGPGGASGGSSGGGGGGGGMTHPTSPPAGFIG